MQVLGFKGARALTLLVFVATVAACGLPRSGPNRKEIFAGSVLEGGDAFVVSVNDHVTRATAVMPSLGFSSSFRNAGVIGSDDIRAGDVLGLTIWENVDDGLLAPRGAKTTALTEVQVDGAGNIFVPYAGKIKAAGNSPDGLRKIITSKLDAQTPDPQVTVTRLAGDGATVSVMGAINGQGVYPIERPTRTLSSMIAKAGGVAIEPEVAQIVVKRGSMSERVWLMDLYENPQMDIALRPNDTILVEQDTRSFVTLGATGAQAKVNFETKTLSAIEAIATVGGLSTNLADPKGVFVFRNEPEEIARIVLARDDLIGEQRLIYVLDLTRPNGMFMARDFAIRDNDTVYVTEAPYVQWQKTLAAINGSASAASSINSAAGG